MNIREWFVRKLFGFSPGHYRERMEILLDGMAHQVADVIVYKDKLKKDIASMKETLPSEEWHTAVQNAIKALDERTEDMATFYTNISNLVARQIAEEKAKESNIPIKFL